MSRLRDRTSALHARIADLARRVFPKSTAEALRWIVQGYDAEDEDEHDVFHGAGFASRPAAGSNAEALAVAVNGGDHHVIVATRDADTLRAVVAKLGLEAGEAIVFSAGVALKCSADKVRAQSLEGAAAAVAFKSELVAVQGRLDAIETNLRTHLHVSAAAGLPTGAPFVPPAAAPPMPATTPVTIAGSQVFECE
jgi:hypothetical protein